MNRLLRRLQIWTQQEAGTSIRERKKERLSAGGAGGLLHTVSSVTISKHGSLTKERQFNLQFGGSFALFVFTPMDTHTRMMHV